MTVIYQGKPEQTIATTLAAFLASKGVDTARAIVEANGEIHSPGADLSQVPLTENLEVNVFKVVAGG